MEATKFSQYLEKAHSQSAPAIKHNLFMSLLAIGTLTNEILKALLTKLHISNGFADKHTKIQISVY